MISKLKVASPPHIKRRTKTSTVMIDVIISLVPAIFVAIHYFGFNVAKLIVVSLISAGLSQLAAEKIFKKPSEIKDYSFAVTAILLALILPHTTPLWVAVLGNIFAIVVGKVIFGGLGKNIFNPALLGRVFLMISFPQYVLHYKTYDGQSGATILPMMKYMGIEKIYNIFGGPVDFYQALITGNNIYGSMGETSIAAIIVGLIYLKLRGHVKTIYTFFYHSYSICPKLYSWLQSIYIYTCGRSYFCSGIYGDRYGYQPLYQNRRNFLWYSYRASGCVYKKNNLISRGSFLCCFDS